MDHAGHHNGGFDNGQHGVFDDDQQGGGFDNSHQGGDFDDSQQGGGFDDSQQGGGGFDKHILDHAQHAEEAISHMIEDHRIEELIESWHQLEEFLDRITMQLQHLEKLHDHHCPHNGDEAQGGGYQHGQHSHEDENCADSYDDGEWEGDEHDYQRDDGQGYGDNGHGHF
jgi:hypothetical protein